jgi:hypothetical protein
MSTAEDILRARDYVAALALGDHEEMRYVLQPYLSECSGSGEPSPEGIIKALARIILLQAGPRPDVIEHLDRLTKTLTAIRHD